MRYAIFLLLSASSLSTRPASAQELEQYVVREGEDCGTIARRRYGSAQRYDRIHQHNPHLGPMPHRLRAGTVLRLPPAETSDPDARLTAARRQVESQRPQASQWDRARVGQALFQGWRVSTGEESSAELTFRSSSVAAIREHTLVIVYGNEARRERREGNRAVVRQGALLSRLSSLSGGEPLEVETPSAVATLRNGEASVDVDPDGTTRVAAHRGQSARVRSRSASNVSPGNAAPGAEVEVPEGHGTSVRPNAPPTAPRPLPRAPAWAPDQPSRFLGLTDRGGSLRGAWLAAPNARAYRVEIARREDGRDLMIGTEVPADVTRFELHHFPPGRYFIRVCTRDAEGFEGRPASPVVLDVIGVTIVAPGDEPPAPPPPAGPSTEGQASLLGTLDGVDAVDFDVQAPGPAPVLAGSRLIAPEGVTCAAGTSAPSRALVFDQEGDLHLTCVDASGANIVGLDVAVRRVAIEVRGADGSDGPILLRDRDTVLVVGVRTGAIDESEIAVAGGPGLRVVSTERRADGSFLATMHAGADAPDQSEVRVVRAGHEDVVLAAGPVLLDDPEAPVPAALVPRRMVASEGLGLAAFTSWVGLRDERRRGSGIWTSLAIESARTGEPDVRVRLAAGVRASLLDERLRLDTQVPLQIVGHEQRSADRGSRDVYAAIGSLILDGEAGLGLAVDAGIWMPSAGAQGLDRGRLQVGADLSLRIDRMLVLRTRQAGIFDLMSKGSMLWASAYGVDLSPIEPLILGVEGTMVIGYEDGRDWYAGGIALQVALDLRPIVPTIAIRYGFGDDLFPSLTAVFGVRGAFER